MEIKIHTWDEIKNDYKDSLILGNGSSIAISENFKYDSLFKKGCELQLIDNRLKAIFTSFRTQNFETVLHKLLQAKIVNEILSNNNQSQIIKKAYQNCRNSLIKIVRILHPKYEEISLDQLNNISNFLENFKTVISLNYDLILYWAMYSGNKKTKNRLKDGFTEKNTSIEDKCFNPNWQKLRESYVNCSASTLIFYLHGNLSLANYINKDAGEFEVKITSPDTSHLDEIYKKWETGHYSPLFVCEGETKRKLISITGSGYLNTIYHSVFNNLGETLVVYGWKMDKQDDHVLDQLKLAHQKNQFKKVAVSVYKDGEENEYIQRIRKKIDKIDKQLEIQFYDSSSKNCWNNP